MRKIRLAIKRLKLKIKTSPEIKKIEKEFETQEKLMKKFEKQLKD